MNNTKVLFSVFCVGIEKGERDVKSLASSYATGLFSSYIESNKGFCHATKKGTATLNACTVFFLQMCVKSVLCGKNQDCIAACVYSSVGLSL